MVIGAIIDYAGNMPPPPGYLMCDGAAVSRTTFADLFAAIGTSWGVGDGATTFNVPDLRGRAAIGSGTGAGLTARTLADTIGEESHTLTVAELAVHDHEQRAGSGAGAQNACTGTATSSNPDGLNTTSTTQSAGTGSPHNTMMPCRVTHKCIKT